MLLWQSMDVLERVMAIALCVVTLAVVAALVTVLISSSKRKKAQKTPEFVAPPPQPIPVPIIPDPLPAANDYEKTTLIHEPLPDEDAYEKTVSVDYRPSIEVTFRISGTVGVMERVLPVSGDFIIGRKAEYDLQLDDSSVSLRHAQLSAEGGILRAQDLGSTNGVYLNGHRLEGIQPLRPGDTLRIGTIDIRVLYTPTETR